jgi:hypothetical protein
LRAELVESLVGEAEELDLGHRDHPAEGEADRRADDTAL